MKFEVLGPIEQTAVIAHCPRLSVRAFLIKAYGPGRWRKTISSASWMKWARTIY